MTEIPAAGVGVPLGLTAQDAVQEQLRRAQKTAMMQAAIERPWRSTQLNDHGVRVMRNGYDGYVLLLGLPNGERLDILLDHGQASAIVAALTAPLEDAPV